MNYKFLTSLLIEKSIEIFSNNEYNQAIQLIEDKAERLIIDYYFSLKLMTLDRNKLLFKYNNYSMLKVDVYIEIEYAKQLQL